MLHFKGKFGQDILAHFSIRQIHQNFAIWQIHPSYDKLTMTVSQKIVAVEQTGYHSIITALKN